MGAFPQDFQGAENSSYYLNKIKPGDTKLRVLSEFIAGMECWVDKDTGVPVESGGSPKRVKNADGFSDMGQRAMSHPFVAVVVWDYQDSKLKIWNISKSTIYNRLRELDSDDEWGDIRGYDIKVTKTGTGKETRYSVLPLKPVDLDEVIVKSYKEAGINLQAMYATAENPYGGDPFKRQEIKETAQVEPSATEQTVDPKEIEAALADEPKTTQQKLIDLKDEVHTEKPSA